MSLLQAARPLNPWRWLGTPALACVAATIVCAIPFRVYGLQLPQPVFPMILAFSWALIRPSIIAPFILLLLGLFLDVYWGGPVGLWGISLLAAYGTVLSARSIMTGQSRSMRQVWFGATAGLAIFCAFLLSAITSATVPNLWSVFWMLLATTLLYPFSHRLIERFEDADVRFR